MVPPAVIPGFTEAWFHADSQATIADLVQLAPAGLLVEVGSWEGRSTCALANACHPRLLHAVDTWRGSPGEISADLAAKRDVHARFLANVEHYTRGNVQPHRMGWREYVRTVTESVAFLFVDAEHSYREVFDNVTAFLPLMAPGGIMCGDDVHHGPVKQALLDIFPADQLRSRGAIWIHEVPA